MYRNEYLEGADKVDIFEQGTNGKGHRLGYQYIVDFDSNLGDLPALVVDGTGLSPDNSTNTNASVAVLNCDWYVMQTITTSALDQIAGSFYIRFKEDRTPDLRWDIGKEQMKQAIESLDQVISATVLEMEGPGVNGGYRWTIRLDSIEGEYEPMYAEGHLLEVRIHRHGQEPLPLHGGQQLEMLLWNLTPKAQFRCRFHGSALPRGAWAFVARPSGADTVSANVSHIDQGLTSLATKRLAWTRIP